MTREEIERGKALLFLIANEPPGRWLVGERAELHKILLEHAPFLLSAAEDALRYREALEFYASPEAYKMIYPGSPRGAMIPAFESPANRSGYHPEPVMSDRGERARAALAPKEESRG